MMFKQRMIDAIRLGTKTETRRPCKSIGHCPWVVGKDYAVQPGRGKKAVGRIEVTAVELQHLGSITDEEARAEGFGFRAEFLVYWTLLYGKADRDELVWVIRFRKHGEWVRNYIDPEPLPGGWPNPTFAFAVTVQREEDGDATIAIGDCESVEHFWPPLARQLADALTAACDELGV